MSSKQHNDLEHYNRASRARRRDDFNLAVAELDLCLGSSPHPLLEALAWFSLGEIIFLNFDFRNRLSYSVSDEEYYWSIRAGEAMLRSIVAIERCSAEGVQGNEAMVRDCHNAYEKAQALNEFFASYDPYIVKNGKREYRPDVVFRDLRLTPLRCLAEFESKARRDAAATLKLNGLYFNADGFITHLKFYEDGLIGCHSSGNPHDVIRWLDRDHPAASKGRYELQGRQIQIGLTLSSGGTDSYSGWVLSDSLELVGSISLPFRYEFFDLHS